MDKNCKIVLQKILQTKGQDNFRIYYWELQKEAQNFGFSEEEFAKILRQLAADGFGDILHSSTSGAALDFSLTHKGRHYKKFLRNERWKTIILPAIITAIVGLLVGKITGLLSLLLQWFSNTLE